jgi:MscS family membrane protein
VFNLNISSIIAGLGIGGLAFALAAKETLENLLGSFTIFLDKPFGLGDYIQFGNTFGTVDKIGFRSTRIITDEKSIITVPNKKLVDTELNNLSLRPARRIKMNFTLVYETSIETVQTIIKQLEEHFKKHPWVTDDYKVRVFEFSDLGITILVDYFIIKIDYDSSLISRQETNLVIKQLVETNNAKFAVRKML